MASSLVAARNGAGRKGPGRGHASAVVRSLYESLAEVKTAMQTKLSGSKLTMHDATTLRMHAYTASEVQKRFPTLPAHRAGIFIPYFDIDGRPTKFFRFRYLEYGHDTGFKALVADQLKQLRYGQPKSSANEIYLPPFIDWRAYAQDVSKPIVITEGEFKAACATKLGIPTLGLGGVWSFKSSAQHQPLLEAFKQFVWRDRVVYICYDSDAVTNHQVIKAENALARELMLLGAVPHVARLPQIAIGVKCGIDDYIVARGVDSLMQDVLLPTETWRAAQELYALNEEVVYVIDPGLILKLENLQRMTARAFVDHAYADRIYYEEIVTDKATKMQERSAAKEWLKWPQRAKVTRITYEPGQDRVVNGQLNTWSGWGCLPSAGTIAPWTKLLDYLFTGAKDEDRKWFEQWLAYPLQFPGEKLYSAAVFWGIHHGTGKSLVGYTMFKIYGANATEIGDRDLYSNHNEWAEHRQFVMGDEITGGDKRNTADRMKSMITQKQLRLNPKYVPSYVVPDHINYYFTSNHPDAFFLEDTDRRFFIHEVKTRPLEQDYYKNYMKWLEQEQGAEHLFWHFLHLDLTGFDPQGHAPSTASKIEMIDTGRSDLGSWVARLREDPDRVLRLGNKELKYTLFTSEELRMIYDPGHETRVTANGLARELRRAGFSKVYDGMGVLTATNGQQRLWAVRDVERLLKLRGPTIAEIYDKERAFAAKNGIGNNGSKKSKF